ncbi:hypothetical protein LIER_33632 [Lithospermum erythrorhizon]|uniref:Uncharacterized protein n=1 Tax=Lithospermum erythrorhizon TaxID=34254 RepID=A0AAV3RZH6_LITER
MADETLQEATPSNVNSEEQLQRHRVVTPDRDAVMAMAVQTPSRSTHRFDSRSKVNVTCTFCHRSGHDISSCFSKHGFSEWWGIVLEVRTGSGAQTRWKSTTWWIRRVCPSWAWARIGYGTLCASSSGHNRGSTTSVGS